MASNPAWGAQTGGLEVTKAFAAQVRGRNVLITGIAPKGIGSSTAEAIASQNPAVLVLASRTREKVEQVASSIRSAYPGVHVETVLVDLASQRSVRNAADHIKGVVPKLDILINNAAVVVNRRTMTPENIEIQFGVSHIGHFLLTKLLLPLLERAAEQSLRGATRVVTVSSQGHQISPIRFHDYNFENKPIPKEEEPNLAAPPAFRRVSEDGYMPMVAYGQAKTANVLFTVYLQAHLKSRGITSYAVHPGTIDTDLGRDQDPEMIEAIVKLKPFWKSLDQGAATTLVAALDPKLNESVGLYLSDCQFADPAAHARDSEAAGRLWQLSEELTHEGFKL